MTPSDRRAFERRSTEAITATLRLQYRLGRIQAAVLDFNRHGMSVRLDQALPDHGAVDLDLHCGPIQIYGVVGVIHNCRSLGDGAFRCGVQFRPEARVQFDRNQIKEALEQLELYIDRTALPPAASDAATDYMKL